MATQEELETRIAHTVELILDYGSIDGAHHKQWVLDQALRILTGCPLVTRMKKDHLGNPFVLQVLGENEEYTALIKNFCQGEEGPDDYEWDTGIAP